MEATRGIKQAIVAQAILDHGVKSLAKPPKQETKEEIIKAAQKKLDARQLGGDARQIVNYLFNPAHLETTSGRRSLTDMAERLKATGAAVRKATKKPAKKSAARPRKSNVKEHSEAQQQAA